MWSSTSPALNYKPAVTTILETTSEAKLKLKPHTLYLAQTRTSSLIYGVITPSEKPIKKVISKEELDKELTTVGTKELFSALRSNDPLNKLNKFLPAILKITARRGHTQYADPLHIPVKVVTSIVFPFCTIRDIIKVSLVNTEYNKFICSYKQTGLKKLLSVNETIKKIETKKKVNLRKKKRKETKSATSLRQTMKRNVKDDAKRKKEKTKNMKKFFQ